MGFDIGYHAIDINLIKNDLLPYCLGEKTTVTNLQKIVRACQKRSLANACGSQIYAYLNKIRKQETTNNKVKFKGLFQKVFSNLRTKKTSLDILDLSNFSKKFDPDLYLWGRPFFITENSPESVAQIIEKYLSENHDEINVIKQQIENLYPTLFDDIDTSDVSIPKIDPNVLMEELNLLKNAFANLETGKLVKLDEEREVDPEGLICNQLIFCLIKAASHLGPTWMERGSVWPTLLIQEAGLSTNLLTDASAFVEEATNKIPELKNYIYPTITENYQIGGVVLPENISDFITFIHKNKKILLQKPQNEGWEKEFELAFQKLNECLFYAEAKQYAFVESSEVYSAPYGILS